MNEVISAILSRRSIRTYTHKAIADADRDLIVKAGLYAPSAKNAQGWHITVVQNADAIDEITREVKAALIRNKVERYLFLANNPSYRAGFGAPTFVIVSADPKVSFFPQEDCALVLGNMFLAAHALGIGSCWVNQLGPVCDDPTFRKLITRLGVPESCKVYCSAAFGYNAGTAPDPLPRKEGTVNVVK